MKKILTSTFLVAGLIASSNTFAGEICSNEVVSDYYTTTPYYSDSSIKGEDISYSVKTEDNKYVFVKNGVESEKYTSSRIFIPSPNMYSVILENGNYILVRNGVKSKEYEMILDAVESNDGKNYAFAATKENGKTVVIRDGVESEEYDNIRFFNLMHGLEYSQDGESLVYFVENDGRAFFVLDGEKSTYSFTQGESEEAIYPDFAISPDKNTILYKAEENGKFFIVKNGVKEKEYDNIHDIKAFDGVYHYVAFLGGKYVLIRNGKEIGTFDNYIYSVGKDTFVATDNEFKNFILKDNIKGKTYSAIYRVNVSEDGINYTYTAIDQEEYFVVRNGVEGKKYDKVDYLTQTKSGENYAYVVKNGSEAFIVRDGVEGKRFNDILQLKYSPNSTDLFYVISTGKDYRLMKNDEEIAIYSHMGDIMISENGSVAFGAQDSTGNNFMARYNCSLTPTEVQKDLEEVTTKLQQNHSQAKTANKFGEMISNFSKEYNGSIYKKINRYNLEDPRLENVRDIFVYLKLKTLSEIIE